MAGPKWDRILQQQLSKCILIHISRLWKLYHNTSWQPVNSDGFHWDIFTHNITSGLGPIDVAVKVWMTNYIPVLCRRNYLGRTAIVCFRLSPLVCLFVFLSVCLSLCLSVSNIKNEMSGFSRNFQGRSDMRQRTICNILIQDRFFLYPGSIFLFSGLVLHNNITEKLVNGFSWKFQDMLETTQQYNWIDWFMPN